MRQLVITLGALAMLAACSGPAVVKAPQTPDPDDSVVDLPGSSDGTGKIRRYEPKDGEGSGYARAIRYEARTDRFYVDNLAFDGANSPYRRSAAMPRIGGASPKDGPFRVYEGPKTFPDSVTGTPISQYQHRAIRGRSRSGATEFAIVRTGSYRNYGFGGFVYERNGTVTLPLAGTQAHYEGAYAGLVDFKGTGGLLQSTADMEINVDFEDFNDGAAVDGAVTNRAFYDTRGREVTGSYLAALNEELGYKTGGYSKLPTLHLEIAPGALSANGEISGGVGNAVRAADGSVADHETGTYYGVIAGDSRRGKDEIAGVLVVTSKAPGQGGSVVMRETGGFILYRK